MKKISKSVVVIFIALLLLMSLPVAISETCRGVFAAILAPAWGKVSFLRNFGPQEIIVSQSGENQPNPVPCTIENFQNAITARVIFRSPSTWNSSLWINVGEETNLCYENPIIAKNSPILIGQDVVGVIDYVGKRQSRVRLITDSGLVFSVRVARGNEQDKAIAQLIDELLFYINSHTQIFDDSQEKKRLELTLSKLQQKLLEKSQTWFLAKGEIRGLSYPLWRRGGHLLKGSGFNYDFGDEYGPARDLRLGNPVGKDKSLKAMPLIKVHDLLITTGLDGVFPPGLKVARVSKIHVLKEGDYAYEIEARPCVNNLDDLTWVYIIAPIGFDFKDRPSCG